MFLLFLSLSTDITTTATKRESLFLSKEIGNNSFFFSNKKGMQRNRVWCSQQLKSAFFPLLLTCVCVLGCFLFLRETFIESSLFFLRLSAEFPLKPSFIDAYIDALLEFPEEITFTCGRLKHCRVFYTAVPVHLFLSIFSLVFLLETFFLFKSSSFQVKKEQVLCASLSVVLFRQP